MATEAQWQGWPGRQHRWVVLVRAGDETASQAGLRVMLPKLKQSDQAAGINWNQLRPTYWLSAAFAFLASPRLASWMSLDLEGKVTLFPRDLSLTKI